MFWYTNPRLSQNQIQTAQISCHLLQNQQDKEILVIPYTFFSPQPHVLKKQPVALLISSQQIKKKKSRKVLILTLLFYWWGSWGTGKQNKQAAIPASTRTWTWTQIVWLQEWGLVVELITANISQLATGLWDAWLTSHCREDSLPFFVFLPSPGIIYSWFFLHEMTWSYLPTTVHKSFSAACWLSQEQWKSGWIIRNGLSGLEWKYSIIEKVEFQVQIIYRSNKSSHF